MKNNTPSKRSKSLSLVLMGTLALGPAACGSEKAEDQFVTYTSLEQCVAGGLFSQDECRDLALGALAERPAFATQAECEASFGAGNCNAPGNTAVAEDASGNTGEIRPHTGSMWLPMMMGFMAGRYMGGNGMMQGSQGLYRDPAAGPGAPSYRTAGGATVSPDPKGRVANPSPALRQSFGHNAKPAVSRGSAASRGGFSGGSRFGGAGS